MRSPTPDDDVLFTSTSRRYGVSQPAQSPPLPLPLPAFALTLTLTPPQTGRRRLAWSGRGGEEPRIRQKAARGTDCQSGQPAGPSMCSIVVDRVAVSRQKQRPLRVESAPGRATNVTAATRTRGPPLQVAARPRPRPRILEFDRTGQVQSST